jgi:hypothetical protein
MEIMHVRACTENDEPLLTSRADFGIDWCKLGACPLAMYAPVCGDDGKFYAKLDAKLNATTRSLRSNSVMMPSQVTVLMEKVMYFLWLLLDKTLELIGANLVPVHLLPMPLSAELMASSMIMSAKPNAMARSLKLCSL